MSDTGRPASIGRYQILATLGTGAMGSVFKAFDPVIGRNVAVKVIRIDSDSEESRASSVARFRAEVQAAGRCAHPAIVGVYDFLEEAGNPAIVMELVEGSSLHAAMRDPARLAALPVADIMLQVLDGLGVAHKQGVIHRDIKPANILLTRDGHAKIADFGIARLPDSATTQTGVMIGTPSYMAPEQLTDEPVDGRTDLFAVGAILYEMLAGRPPFTGRNVSETVMRLLGPDPADMTPIAANGAGYVGVIRRALDKMQSRRFQTAEAFAAALRSAAAGSADPQATVVMAPRAATGIEPAVLAQAERELARIVGPMARTMVTRAAQGVTSAGDLYAALTHELPTAAERSRFLRAVGGGRVEPSLGGRPRTEQTRGEQTRGSLTTRPAATSAGVTQSRTLPGAPGGGAVSADAAAKAQAALAEHLGPIARVLVRDAAAQALSTTDFIERVCRHVEKPDVRSRLQRRLRTEVGSG